VTNTRHTLRFDVPVPPSTATNQSYPDKEQLRYDILSLRAEGLSYRAIGEAVGAALDKGTASRYSVTHVRYICKVEPAIYALNIRRMIIMAAGLVSASNSAMLVSPEGASK
jgi:hypothetical protein